MAGARVDSGSIHWCSPLWSTEGANRVLGRIDVDPCGNPASRNRVRAEVTYELPLNDGLRGLPWWEAPVKDRKPRTFFVNSPFGTSYVHKETKQILLPKEMKRQCDSFCVDPKKPNALEKANIKKFRDAFDVQDIGDWVEMCARAHRDHGMEGIQLGPLNADTVSWQEHVEKVASAILYIKGRPYFELIDFETAELLQTGPAPMACALTCFAGPEVTQRFAETFSPYGAVHILR